MTTLGSEIRRLRLRRGMTQEQLAECLSVSREWVSRIENDIIRPSYGLLHALDLFIGLNKSVAQKLLGGASFDGLPSLTTIAALPTKDERLAEWAKLPLDLRQAIVQLVSDVVTDYAVPRIDA